MCGRDVSGSGFRLQEAMHLVPVDAHFVAAGSSEKHVFSVQTGDNSAGRHVVDVERVGHILTARQPDGRRLLGGAFLNCSNSRTRRLALARCSSMGLNGVATALVLVLLSRWL